MKAYRARYTAEAAARIRRLHPEVKREIKEGIRVLLQTPLLGHALQSELAGLRSFRIRSYRVIYHINEDDVTLDIIWAGPRRNVYEELKALLLESERGDW